MVYDEQVVIKLWNKNKKKEVKTMIKRTTMKNNCILHVITSVGNK